MAQRKKYVLCLPRGGFNDVLCQIEKAFSYAQRTDRICVVDTTKSSLQAPLDSLFISNSHRLILNPSEELVRRFDAMSVVPPFLHGRLGMHTVNYVRGKGHVEESSGKPVSFDFNRDYAEDLLVHHKCGGESNGILLLKQVRLREELAAKILRALTPLGADYDGIHIRNTDMRTNYVPFFKRIFPKLRQRTVLVCSDDLACREYAKRFFVEARVISVTSIPQVTRSLHYFGQNPEEKNTTMLTDLIGLARSRQLFIEVSERGSFSGFSRLAMNLHDFPDILAGLLGQQG